MEEIGELDLRLQARLLRLLEDRSFHRIGATPKSRGAIVEAASALGISGATMWEKMRGYHIKASQNWGEAQSAELVRKS